MKVPLYIFLLFAFGYHECRAASIKDTINGYVEGLRDSIPDVISISDLAIEIPENNYLSGLLDLRDVKLTGIKEFKLDIHYLLSIIPDKFNVSVDYIDLNLKYLSDLTLLNISLLKIFGEGNALIVLENLGIQGSIDYGSLPANGIQSVQISLGNARFLIDGLLNDEKFSNQVSDYLNNNFLILFNQNSELIASIVQAVANGVINGLLSSDSSPLNQNGDSSPPNPSGVSSPPNPSGNLSPPNPSGDSSPSNPSGDDTVPALNDETSDDR